MGNSSSVDAAKVKKVIKFLITQPDIKVPQAMKLSNFSNEEVANLTLCCFIWQSLPSKTVTGLKALLLGPLPPPPAPPDQAEWLCHCAIDVTGVHVE
jgi:hypothetical protein